MGGSIRQVIIQIFGAAGVAGFQRQHNGGRRRQGGEADAERRHRGSRDRAGNVVAEVILEDHHAPDAIALMHQVEGVIIASYYHRPIKLPDVLPKNVVIADAFADGIELDAFVPNEYDSFMQLLDLLGAEGHKHVGFISDNRNFPAVKGRKAAFKAAAKKYGWVDASESMKLVSADATSELGYNAFLELIAERPQLTAVAAYNDQIAMGIYAAAHEMGLSIPGDLSIVGFDNLELISGALRPGLTTVELPHYAMGRMAAERLIERYESEDELPPEKVTIVGDIYVRGSVAAPRASAA